MLSSLALLILLASAPPDSLAEDAPMSLIQGAIEQYARPFDPEWDATTMRVAWADLDADGHKDALVYLNGPAWCGSGGCTLLVFEAVDSLDVAEIGPFAPVAEVSLMHGPVIVAPEQSHGWYDLVVRDAAGTQRRLSFDGETYPFSPAEGEPADVVSDGATVHFADA